MTEVSTRAAERRSLDGVANLHSTILRDEIADRGAELPQEPNHIRKDEAVHPNNAAKILDIRLVAPLRGVRELHLNLVGQTLNLHVQLRSGEAHISSPSAGDAGAHSVEGDRSAPTGDSGADHSNS